MENTNQHRLRKGGRGKQNGKEEEQRRKCSGIEDEEAERPHKEQKLASMDSVHSRKRKPTAAAAAAAASARKRKVPASEDENEPDEKYLRGISLSHHPRSDERKPLC